MADTNAKMEELAQILEQVNYEMAQYGRITKQTADDRFDAEVKAKYGINNATKGLEKMGEAVTSVADAAIGAGKAMYEGKKGAAAFNDSIDSMAKAAQAAGIALSLMIPGGPLIKLFVAGMTAAVTATAAYVKAANEMADKLYKGYNGIAKAGAAAADGMTGMYKGAKKLGLSMNELDGYVSLVAASSKDLALFSTTVFEGRKQFEDVGSAMESFRVSAFAAGMTQQELNEGTMGYIKLQSRLGYAQKMSTDELAQGAKKYLIEQDALTKLTGISRKEMEDQREAALMEEQFAAKIRQLQLDGNHKAAKELQDLNILYSQAGKEMGQGFRALATGNLSNDQAQKMNLASQGEVMRQNQLIEAGMATAAQAFGPAAKVIGKTADELGTTLGQFGAYSDTFGNLGEQQKLRILAEKDYDKQLELIKEEQAKQGLLGGKAVDGITDQYAKNIKQQQELNKEMEDAVFKGIGNALTVTKKLGDVTEYLTTVFDKLATAANKLLKVVGLGVDDPAVAAAKEKEASAKKQREEAQDAAKRAVTETEKQAAATALAAAEERLNQAQREKTQAVRAEGGIPTVPSAPAMNETAGGAAVGVRMRGGLRSKAAPTAPTPAPLSDQSNAEARRLGIPPGKGVPAEATSGTIKLEDYINFGSNTGDRAHFDQLHPTIRDSFVEMAKQYFETTGNKLQVNSAFRSAEEQGKVNSGPNPKAAPGMSLHQQGRAVDINSDQRSALEKMGLLGQYGFNPLPGDPPHIFMAKGGIVGARAGGTEIIAGEAGQDEAVIPLEGGAVPVNLNMKPPEATDSNMLQKVLESGFKEIAASLSGSMPVSVNMKPQASTDAEHLDRVFESGFSEMSTAFAKLTDIDLLSKTLAQIKDRQFGLPDASEVASSEDATSTKVFNEMSGNYEKMLATALEKQAAQQEEQSMRMIDALTEMIRAQKDSNSIQEKILQTSM